MPMDENIFLPEEAILYMVKSMYMDLSTFHSVIKWFSDGWSARRISDLHLQTFFVF